MKRELMTGNEAIARGAYEGGVHFASAYPGTPSSEILANILLYDEIESEWAPNEKVALEATVGASYVGGRSITAMKHVGLNVAADPLFTLAYAGVLGGMVIVSADEPGMHSSQNEQDNRNYAKFSKIPMFEPSTSMEAKEFVKDALTLSEEYDAPVLLRMTTRMCHSKGIVEFEDRIDVKIKEYEKNISKNVLVPSVAREARVRVEERTNKLKELSNNCKWNYIIDNNSKVGVVTSGGAFEYAREVFGDDATYLKIGLSYPLPDKLIKELSDKVDKIYVIEENDPYLEEHIKAMGIMVYGKDTFPYTGEMTPDVIRKSVYNVSMQSTEVDKSKIISRPPTFCSGCPHREFFLELGKRKDTVVAGDIGCYSLAFTEPYNSIDWILCMGGSFSTGHGAAKILNMKKENKKRVVSVLGDSTFFHTGINSLIDVVYNNSNTINVILDNRITAMTGGQENPGSGFNAKGEISEVLSIEKMVKACGIKNVKTVNPNNKKDVTEVLNWAYTLDEPSVIITEWPCVLKRRYDDNDKSKYKDVFTTKYKVIDELCIGCKKCLKTGCPSLGFNNDDRKATIDKYTCVGCNVCANECPVDAIILEEK